MSMFLSSKHVNVLSYVARGVRWNEGEAEGIQVANQLTLKSGDYLNRKDPMES
jgi:hypothetical protein